MSDYFIFSIIRVFVRPCRNYTMNCMLWTDLNRITSRSLKKWSPYISPEKVRHGNLFLFTWFFNLGDFLVTNQQHLKWHYLYCYVIDLSHEFFNIVLFSSKTDFVLCYHTIMSFYGLQVYLIKVDHWFSMKGMPQA